MFYVSLVLVLIKLSHFFPRLWSGIEANVIKSNTWQTSIFDVYCEVL
jgi:hypothetical protein